MIEADKIRHTAEAALEGTPLYVVGVSVSPENDIVVDLDSDGDIDVEQCAAVSRAIEATLDRDVEDFSLEVGSAGITSPLRDIRQFAKYRDEDMEVLTRDGRKLHGVLGDAHADGDDIVFELEMSRKVKPEGAKRPVVEQYTENLHLADCKYVQVDLRF